MALDEFPQPLEVALAPRRIDDEVAGDAVAEAAAPRRCPARSGRPSRPSSGRSAPRRSPPRGRRRCRSRPPAAATLRAAPDGAPPDRRGSAPASSACGCRGGASSCASSRLRDGWCQNRSSATKTGRRPTRSRGRPSRSTARAPCARAAARSSRTSSGTDSRARSRSARPADAPDRRIVGASGPRDAAPAAARRRARACRSRRRCGCHRR